MDGVAHDDEILGERKIPGVALLANVDAERTVIDNRIACCGAASVPIGVVGDKIEVAYGRLIEIA